jgi:translation elongation factor EF-Tu-like GTPase
MMKRLMIVEDAFDIAGRGRVLAGIAEDRRAALRNGDDSFVLQLRSGERMHLRCVAVERFTGTDAIGVLIEPDSLKTDSIETDSVEFHQLVARDFCQSEIWVETGVDALQHTP